MGIHDQRFQDRMVSACRAWLDWCAAHHQDPLASDVEQLRHAVLDLRSQGATRLQLMDLIDQVGFMTAMWRSLDWFELRRSICARAQRAPRLRCGSTSESTLTRPASP